MLERQSNTKTEPEKAVLVGLITQHQDKNKIKEYLDELAFLVETAGGIPVQRFTQSLESPNPKTFVGTGKLEEIRQYIKAAEIDLAVFDDEKKHWNAKSLTGLTSSSIFSQKGLKQPMPRCRLNWHNINTCFPG